MKLYNLECKICSATLASKRGLVLHNKAVHEGTKFDCKFCEKTFSFSTNMKKHVSSVHEGRRPFKCQLCDSTYKAKRHLNYHSSIHEHVTFDLFKL